MLKNISNLGTIINKEDQKSINGGGLVIRFCNAPHIINPDLTCPAGYEQILLQCCKRF